MATWRAIVIDIWNSSWWPKASRETQVFWIFLVTNPASQPSGLYPLNWRVAGSYLRMGPNHLDDCREAVVNARAASFADNWVFVHKFISYQPYQKLSVWKAILRQVGKAPVCLLYAWLQENSDRVPEGCKDILDRLTAQVRDKSETSSGLVPVDMDVRTRVQLVDMDMEIDMEPLKEGSRQSASASTPCAPPYQEILQEWNEFAKLQGLPEMQKWTEDRKTHARAKWAAWTSFGDGDPWVTLARVQGEIAASTFLREERRISLPTILERGSYWLKIIEGNYRDQVVQPKEFA